MGLFGNAFRKNVLAEAIKEVNKKEASSTMGYSNTNTWNEAAEPLPPVDSTFLPGERMSRVMSDGDLKPGDVIRLWSNSLPYTYGAKGWMPQWWWSVVLEATDKSVYLRDLKSGEEYDHSISGNAPYGLRGYKHPNPKRFFQEEQKAPDKDDSLTSSCEGYKSINSNEAHKMADELGILSPGAVAAAIQLDQIPEGPFVAHGEITCVCGMPLALELNITPGLMGGGPRLICSECGTRISTMEMLSDNVLVITASIEAIKPQYQNNHISLVMKGITQ